MRTFQNRFLSKVAIVISCIALCGGCLSFGKGKGKGGKGDNGGDSEGGSNPQANGEGAGNGSGNNGSSSPTAENLAAIIAGDAGGDSDQYRIYAVNLEKTLAQLTPEQRARVFSD